jgi:hypothetical protein
LLQPGTVAMATRTALLPQRFELVVTSSCPVGFAEPASPARRTSRSGQRITLM